MKKIVKKLAATGISITSVVSLAACGSGSTTTSSNSNDIQKPDQITVMADTIVNENNGGQAFYDYLAQLTGLDIKQIHPDHAGYYDAVANAFNADSTMPDVVQVSSDYYALYASNGFLWNMTDAWENSDTKKSGRMVSTADKVFDSCHVCGEDGATALYGFPTARGNGCLTYVKKAWLKDAGIDPATIEDKTLDFNTYYDMCKKMAEKKGHYVISAPGFICKAAPYTNYLPEFYQDAHYNFYKDTSGKYVDGFSEKSMQDALQRLQTGVNDGVIDRETVNNSTGNCRDKFYSTNPDSETGVFTYWAGKWNYTLKANLEVKGMDGDLIALKPIKELGSYMECLSGTWCITTHCTNPQGVFKYFIEAMLDGGDVQTAWTYGAKGTHWDTTAETVTLQGKEGQGTSYKEGEFHLLPSPEKPNTLMQNNNIDPLLALAKYTDTSATPNGADPGDAQIPDLAKSSEQFFVDNSNVEVPLPVNPTLSENITDINTARNYVISQVSLGYMSVDDGMKYYQETVGSKINEVIKSLNK